MPMVRTQTVGALKQQLEKRAGAKVKQQQLSLMLSVWRPRHDICENYPSVQLSDNVTAAGNACTGNRFYVWGALPALMALEA